MGTFLSISIVENIKKNTEEKLLEFSESIQGNLKKLKIDEENILNAKIKNIDKNSTAVLYPIYNVDFYYCAQFISQHLNTSVLTIYIHDNDAWYFVLYNNGQEISRYVSNFETIEENPESWICNYFNLAKIYNSNETILKNYLEKINSKKNSNNCLNEVSEFLKLLKFPINKIFSFKSYKSILSEETLNSIKKPFISLLDLRKTKKYTKELLKLNQNELKELFTEEIKFIEKETKGANNINYFLNIESLTLQVFGNFPNKNEPILIINLAFSHKMEEVQSFLNK